MNLCKTVFALLVMMLFAGVNTISAATIPVTTTTDELTTNGQCSLREAITNINDGATTYADCVPTAAYGTSDTINVPAGTYTTTTTSYNIANNVSIVGAGAGIQCFQEVLDPPVPRLLPSRAGRPEDDKYLLYTQTLNMMLSDNREK